MTFWLFRRIVWALCLAAAGARDAGRGPDESREEAALIRAVAEGYQNNRESFGFLTCRFTVTFGSVRSVEDAIAGRWDESQARISRRTATWVYDGNKVSASIKFDGASVTGPAQVDGDEATELQSGDSEHWLTDGSIHFRYFGQSNLGTLFGPDQVATQWGPVATPFSLNIMGAAERANPYAVISEGLEQGLCRYEGEQEVFGRKTLVISAGPETRFRRHYFDPDRGYLAIRIDYTWDPADPQASVRGFVTHVRECSKGRWFPERCVQVTNPDAPPGVLRGCCIIETVELDADEPPAPELLALELPQGLRVGSRSGGLPSRFTLKTPMRLDLSNLDDLLATVVAQGQRRVELPQSPARGLGTLWIALGIGMTILVAFAVLWRLRYAKHSLRSLQRRG